LTCSTAGTSCTVSGLTAGTAYTFKVAATNVAGTGVSSTATGSVTPTLTPTLIEQVTTSGTSNGIPKTLSTGTFASNTTVGDLEILQTATDYSGSTKIQSVSGGGVTTWNSVTQSNGTSGNGDIEIWYGYVTSATTTAVKLTTNNSVNIPLVNVSEWSNIVASNPVDQSTSSTGSASSFTAGPITTTVGGDLVVSDAWTAVTGYGTAQNSTTAGFNILGQSIFSGSYRGWAAYQVTGAAGAYSAGWTQSGSTSGNYGTAIAAFKPLP